MQAFRNASEVSSLFVPKLSPLTSKRITITPLLESSSQHSADSLRAVLHEEVAAHEGIVEGGNANGTDVFLVTEPIHYDDNAVAKLEASMRFERPLLYVTFGDSEQWRALLDSENDWRCWVRKRHVRLDSSSAAAAGDDNIASSSTPSTSYLRQQPWGVTLVQVLCDSARQCPLISFCTSSYMSGSAIERVWNAVSSQSCGDWEWIVVPDGVAQLLADRTALDVLERASNSDPRVDVTAMCRNSGIVGAVKRRAHDLATGRWLVECDHDDDAAEQELVSALQEAERLHPDVGFWSTDWCEATGNANGSHHYTPYRYVEGAADGGLFQRGFGAYGKRVWRADPTAWHNVATATPLQPNALRDILGIPNHARIWRRDVYRAVGGHAPALSVTDDFELVLRTFQATRFGRLAMFGCRQIRHPQGANATVQRSRLIRYLSNVIGETERGAVARRVDQLLAQPPWNGDNGDAAAAEGRSPPPGTWSSNGMWLLANDWRLSSGRFAYRPQLEFIVRPTPPHARRRGAHDDDASLWYGRGDAAVTVLVVVPDTETDAAAIRRVIDGVLQQRSKGDDGDVHTADVALVIVSSGDVAGAALQCCMDGLLRDAVAGPNADEAVARLAYSVTWWALPQYFAQPFGHPLNYALVKLVTTRLVVVLNNRARSEELQQQQMTQPPPSTTWLDNLRTCWTEAKRRVGSGVCVCIRSAAATDASLMFDTVLLRQRGLVSTNASLQTLSAVLDDLQGPVVNRPAVRPTTTTTTVTVPQALIREAAAFADLATKLATQEDAPPFLQRLATYAHKIDRQRDHRVRLLDTLWRRRTSGVPMAERAYLEIGVAEGNTFSCVARDAAVRHGVDPQQGGTHCMTSDEFFARPSQLHYNLIFIDGLHETAQVLRDVANALRHLKHDGVIVLHDCLPLTEQGANPIRQTMDWWNGDVWRAVYVLWRHAARFGLCVALGAFDWGCGVIWRAPSGGEDDVDDADSDDVAETPVAVVNAAAIDALTAEATSLTWDDYRTWVACEAKVRLCTLDCILGTVPL